MPTEKKVREKKEKTKTSGYHKKTFDKIADEKRKRILSAAIKEFASKGFNAANINIIAEKAGISVGSIYNYFTSKEDLFLTIIDSGHSQMEAFVNSLPHTGTTLQKIEYLLRLVQKFGRQYPELNQIYLDLTSESLASLSRRLSRTLETITSEMYKNIIQDGKKNGEIKESLDDNITCFCLDNLIMMLQFSYISEYYKERMKVFIGAAAKDDEAVIRGIMAFVSGAISPK